MWWAEIVISGKRHRESLRTTDAREAERRVEAIRNKIERTAIGIPDEESWPAAVVRWAAEGLSGVKPSVRTRYLSSIRNFDQQFGSLLIASISTRDIAEWVRSRKSGGKSSRTECGTEISNASIQRDLTALSRLMSFCCSIGWRTDNPVQSFDRTIIRERRDPKRPPTLHEIEQVMRAAPAGVAGILGILTTTGMRLAEAVHLERSQVDSKRQQILLTKTKTSRPRTIAWITPGGDATPYLEKGHKKGLLYVSEATEQAYANFSSNVGQVQRRILKDNPFFHRFGVHDLRHAFALRWLKAGGNIYRLSRHLGHSSVKVTEQNYLGYLTVEEQERVQLAAEQGSME
ncbi:tyrosine-type recombinase/integrase [Acetobacter tropicalis]|uniref:tyrosine-type recombinase/integrase n=1 Tax=Acetobacter tropicalis TaxID=104102 RepID=UPI001E462FC5|nr:tyrosine-type recombinase/integrase [Acetobacter tropicalis]MDO8171923.1 tyrosine-type recombinase/integrase [Acetobacter tropicalis]